MITLRGLDERGHTKLTWLDSRRTFSFADYYDSRQLGFHHLRVINKDRSYLLPNFSATIKPLYG